MVIHFIACPLAQRSRACDAFAALFLCNWRLRGATLEIQKGRTVTCATTSMRSNEQGRQWGRSRLRAGRTAVRSSSSERNLSSPWKSEMLEARCWNLSSSWRRGPGVKSPSTTTRHYDMPFITSDTYHRPSTGANGRPLAAWQRSRSQRLEHDVVDDVRAGEGPRRQRDEQADSPWPLFRSDLDLENQRR